MRLHLLTRKSFGGLHTKLRGRVLAADGQPLPGPYAAGEAAGWGGVGCAASGSWQASFWAVAFSPEWWLVRERRRNYGCLLLR